MSTRFRSEEGKSNLFPNIYLYLKKNKWGGQKLKLYWLMLEALLFLQIGCSKREEREVKLATFSVSVPFFTFLPLPENDFSTVFEEDFTFKHKV